MSLYRGAGGSGDATNDASSQSILATASANAAEVSKNQAAASATAAANSATAAAASATSAASSASSAAGAGTSATNAANSATAAASSATAASNSATAASTSATNAANSATTASTQATNAASSASAASTSATNAASSATSASGSASTATTQASSASTSATNAATSATSATNSASTATTQAGIATTQASNASTSATNAATSATSASGSASSAATSATNAASAQTAAEAARDATLTAYDNFDDRYLGTKTSDPTLDNDGNALTAGSLYFNSSIGGMKVYTGSAWVAAYISGSGYLAATSNLSDLTNTATARTNLGVAIGTNVQAYDADLAAIAALAPTTDNFIVGNGTTWILETPAQARTSLGLGTAATTASTDYATAAQGTLAGTALQPAAIGSTVQGYDADLQAIGVLAGTTGLLKKTAANTWSLDTNTYLTSAVTSVTGTAPVASSGGTTPVISLSAGYGDTLNPYASKTANFILSAPNGAAGVPTFRAMVAADVPTLNQNTTGTASNVTGTVAITNGGTGETTRQNAMDALAGAVTSGQYLRGNGTDVVMSAIQSADVPTLNQNTTGNAGTVTNGVYTTGSYSDPSWITSLTGSKINGTIDGGSF